VPRKSAKPLLLHVPGAAGADEAGRGPLAGPVVAAAVVLPDGFDLRGIDDSKQLKREDREALAERVKVGTAWAVAVVDVETIDRINILWASMEAMKRALHLLPCAFDRVLIDGNQMPREMPWPTQPIVDGDATHACIAAASILAKTERDRLMRELGARYPGYGFENHFGYCTPEHLDALRRLGPCDIHRRSFARIREQIEQPCLTFAE
jgi:ribonuclease HII